MAAETHDLHLLNADKGHYVRQTTFATEANCWEVCNADGELLASLDDDEFDALRDPEKPNPKGL